MYRNGESRSRVTIHTVRVHRGWITRAVSAEVITGREWRDGGGVKVDRGRALLDRCEEHQWIARTKEK